MNMYVVCRVYMSWIQVASLLLTLISSVTLVSGQPGFISIDCGSETSYTDSLGITWVSDSNYISTGTNANVTVTSSAGANVYYQNSQQTTDLRFFDQNRSKSCYVLPVTPDTNYLVRATFYPGDFAPLNSNSYTEITVFDIIVETSSWFTYGLYPDEDRSDVLIQEAIFHATRSELDVCLARQQGQVYISALELRELASGMYSMVGPSTNVFFHMYARVNLGNENFAYWRYPDDDYDRIWGYLPTNATNIANTTNLSSSPAYAPDRPPVIVMETAITYEGYPYLTYYQLITARSDLIYSNIYVQELNNSQRGMTFYFDSQEVASFNTSAEPLEVSSPIQNFSGYTATTNISLFSLPGSILSPFLNALEIFIVQNVNNSVTASEDVIALPPLQRRLNLTDWTGDPCVPVPYTWLNCSATAVQTQQVDATSQQNLEQRVTTLYLSGMGITGPIPEEIMNLTALTALYLQNNSLTGEIPSFLAMLNLTQLNLDNNNLSGSVPSSLIRRGLNLTVRNNPNFQCNADACRPPPSNSTSNSQRIGAIVGGIFGGLAGLLIILAIGWCLLTRKRRARENIIKAIRRGDAPQDYDVSTAREALAGSLLILTLQEVSDATKRFSRKLGEGSFGPVYYGRLPNGQEVAIKVKKTESRQGFNQFLNEVVLLSRIHHRNLLSLVGYCEEADQQMLIYVYIPNGTLSDHLYGEKAQVKTLDWTTRLDIALNAARGLEYLHTDCNPRIIHRDVKSNNILLDENLSAKVADFGISKQTPEGNFTGIDTLIRGTPGYFDPEYFISQRLTQKSDVYSFGVVLLEIISGHHPHIRDLPDGSTGTLIQWSQTLIRDGTPLDIVDPALNGEYSEQSVLVMINLALSCIDLLISKRPDMVQVVRTITEATELDRARTGSSDVQATDSKLKAQDIIPERSAELKYSPRNMDSVSEGMSLPESQTDNTTQIEPR